MIRILTLAAVLSLGVAAQAQASSDDAWEELFAKVNTACSEASGSAEPNLSEPVLFDDSIGYVGVVITGEQDIGGTMQTISELCLFDKAAETAAVSEITQPQS